MTATAPYRVLRLVPSPSKAATASKVSYAAAAFRRDVHPAAARDEGGPEGLGETDFEQPSAAEAAQTYDDLIDQTRTLGDAVDLGVDFSFDPTGNLSCSEASCTVNENVSTSTTSREGATLTGSVRPSRRPAWECGAGRHRSAVRRPDAVRASPASGLP